jgi:hypothetical protein
VFWGLIEAEIVFPPFSAITKALITSKRYKREVNVNKTRIENRGRSWSVYRLVTSFPVLNASYRSKSTFRRNQQSKKIECKTPYTRYNRLSSRLANRLANRLYRVYALPTRWPTGLTTGWMYQACLIHPTVRPTVASCIHTYNRLFNRLDELCK